ncbi:hypothetical protein PPL_10913 [Heterostelium album PN500]|uniref:Uncharacterized protein n=1 Tax=Heterostelium pallidum (strain ATCC 26659 / Pp 5 / PN500) TaxID=670386 RepID=D3BSE6_HETP5|nr:hypothetical protein PPL_10913 [Heterostelium album PN500]EFA75652.1 hypothetical protein PPL_10913 [Heterostelium album PN500]|eukprot:XP_020427786.1 hypothetical protein PPL_10913 [Heterostelium album PN500]
MLINNLISVLSFSSSSVLNSTMSTSTNQTSFESDNLISKIECRLLLNGKRAPPPKPSTHFF